MIEGLVIVRAAGFVSFWRILWGGFRRWSVCAVVRTGVFGRPGKTGKCGPPGANRRSDEVPYRHACWGPV